MNKIQKYDLFEMEVGCQSFEITIKDCAVFKKEEKEFKVSAFWKKAGIYGIRFMPEEEGTWNYKIELGGKVVEGKFECVENTGNNHGKVITVGEHFAYVDGSRYIPFGTTAYVWIHQTEEIQRQTIETLENAPFNKIRMCVFPKSMPYNNNDPDCYPFFKNEEGKWDINQPDPRFWDKLDRSIQLLCDLGIEADLIVFHPYDRWGFSQLSQEESIAYLRYCIARLAAYRNLWWSLANEYEMLFAKDEADWDEYGEILTKEDIYHHLLSIHDKIAPYPKREWMTHCSIQSSEINKVLIWKQKYQIPVIIDECGYEGNIDMNWGNLSPFEMTHRFWWTICRGGFCTHGETFHDDNEVLWWAKGGKLYGQSPARIAFLKEILYRLNGDWKALEHGGDPNQREEDKVGNPFFKRLAAAPKDESEAFVARTCPMRIEGEGYVLEYFGRSCPLFTSLMLDENKKYKVEAIDIWEMKISLIADGISGKARVGLPEKEGIAILITEKLDVTVYIR